jgi:outer membrane protein assembly factor BamB
MNSDNILLLGLKNTVTAISKDDGQILWKTELPTTHSGDEFVTVLSDGRFVFAHTEGKLHCLDLANGQILWSNDLKGYGYGIASLCFPGGPSAPDVAAIQTEALKRRQQSSSAAAVR